MNKVYVALVVTFCLGVIAAVGVTLAVLNRNKKGAAAGAAPGQVVWTFHLENGEAPEGGAAGNTLGLDISKNDKYVVNGKEVRPLPVGKKLGGTDVNGFAHWFGEPLKVEKVVVGSNEIVVRRVVPLQGFTVFNKEGKPDFVTLWHDGGFHHYSTDGKLLSDGLFPFANGDESKHPDKMDLPKAGGSPSPNTDAAARPSTEGPSGLTGVEEPTAEPAEPPVAPPTTGPLTPPTPARGAESPESEAALGDVSPPAAPTAEELAQVVGAMADHPELQQAPKAPLEQTKCHPKIKVLTVSGGNVAKVNDYTAFTVSAPPNKASYKYTFNKDPKAECIEVKYRTVTVWKHSASEHGNNYPTVVEFYAVAKMFNIYFNDEWRYTYINRYGEWTLKFSSLKGRPAVLEAPPARTLTYEPEKVEAGTDDDVDDLNEVKVASGPADLKVTTCRETTTVVNDPTHFTISKDDRMFIYRFKENVKCLQVEYMNTLPWKHDINEHQNNHPTKITFGLGAKVLTVYFNSEWYYVYWFTNNKWRLSYSLVNAKPGSLTVLLKSTFNLDLPVSPSLLLYFSNMRISMVRFLCTFYPSIDGTMKMVLDRLYNSDLHAESLASLISDPDKLPRFIDVIKDTDMKLEEKNLNSLLSNPNKLINLAKELKKVGFVLDNLIKTLVQNPEKRKTLLVKLKEFGYAVNEENFNELAKNKELLAYLNLEQPTPVATTAS